MYSNFSSKFAQAPLNLTFEQSFIFFHLKKLFIRLFLTNLLRVDPGPHFKSSWIRIRIHNSRWIWIRKKWMGIHSPGYYKHILQKWTVCHNPDWFCCFVADVGSLPQSGLILLFCCRCWQSATIRIDFVGLLQMWTVCLTCLSQLPLLHLSSLSREFL